MTAAGAAPWQAFDHLDIEAAAARIESGIRATPLIRLPCDDPRIDLRGKMECRQVTGSFKARGALNNVALLTDEERMRGVVASSSGNHGKALAWAARRSGVPATIVMPRDAYPNKIEACREEGAEVVLADDRMAAERITEELAAGGKVLVHPYDRDATMEGAGTVGREIARDWPDVEVVLVCVGGGGLISGVSLALRRALGTSVRIYGAEPRGAATLTLGLEAGTPVELRAVDSRVQGLIPPTSGKRNIEVCRSTIDGVLTLEDAAIFAAQARLVRASDGWPGEVVEPAGAAAYAAVLDGALPDALLERRSAQDPLRVAVTISGGNPAPEQLARLQQDS